MKLDTSYHKRGRDEDLFGVYKAPDALWAVHMIAGRISHVRFHNAETGWTIGGMRPDQSALASLPPDQRAAVATLGDEILVLGPMPGAQVGSALELHGSFITDPKFGVQFKSATCQESDPTTTDGIAEYLGSGVVFGVGPVLAARIVAHFGDQTLAILDKEPHRVVEVYGIGESKAQDIITDWIKTRSQRKTMIFLHGVGLTSNQAGKVWGGWGHKSEELIREDPYRMMDTFDYIGFDVCDAVAFRLEIPKDDPRRLRALILHNLAKEVDDGGHSHVIFADFMKSIGKTLDVDDLTISVQVEQLENDGKIILDNGRLYQARTYQMEINVANMLCEIAAGGCAAGDYPLTRVEYAAQLADGITLTSEQYRILEGAERGGLLVATGGPGCGKSAVTKSVLHVLEAQGRTVALCAPTGKAAVRLSEATGRHASTIHRLLGYRGNDFEHHPGNPLTETAVIVDEVSMVDLSLMWNLLRAVRAGSTLVLVGDVDQLPSVGAGAVLRDVINAFEQVVDWNAADKHVVRLTQIMRQKAGSRIITNAHAINHGDMPSGPPPFADTDFLVQEASTDQEIADQVMRLAVDSAKRMGVDPWRDVQVLVPMYRGAAGINELNARFQTEWDQKLDQIEIGKKLFRVGDKVMQTKNNYRLMVFNGMVGRVVEIEGKAVTVDYGQNDESDNFLVEYDEKSIGELTLAYAASVHKYQGSQVPIVILVLSPSHWFMQYRSLVYTAVTRAQRLLIVVGDLRKAWTRFSTMKDQTRNTTLALRIQEAFGD